MASRSWNRVELIGNLTRDPELRYTPNGAAVCTFGMATNRTYVSEGEKKEEVDFHRLVSWNKLAELCNQLLKKGHRVFVSGRLQTRSWEGQDGIQRQTTEIVIEDMILLTPKGDGAGAYAGGDADLAPVAPADKEAPPDIKLEETSEKKESKEEEPDTVETKDKPKTTSKATSEDVEEDLPF